MKNIRPFLLGGLLCTSAVFASLIGLFYQHTIYADRSFDFFKDPPVEACMLAIKDNSLTTPFEEPTLGIASVCTNYFKDVAFFDIVSFDEQQWEKPGFEFIPVKDDYFADAVFIGDSRTAGIEAYAGFENTTFYAATSMNIFDYNKRKINVDGTKMTVKEALSCHNFNKIYLMIGINDVGISSVDTFYNTYAEVVRDIMSLQPDALIFIEANLHVTKTKSEADSNINNENIEVRNQRISQLADNKRIFYIDVNESSLCDEDGNLLEEYTWDQVHLEAKYYPIWKQYIMEHGIIKKEL